MKITEQFDFGKEVEFVVTLPQDANYKIAYDTKARTTIGVLVQIIAQSNEKIVISAPFFQIGELLEKKSIRYALEGALERGVAIKLATTIRGVKEIKDLDLFQTYRDQIDLYQSSANLNNENILGSHAKLYISDYELAYLGSANFTTNALENHIEMGLLVKGDTVKSIYNFWELLSLKGFYTKIDL